MSFVFVRVSLAENEVFRQAEAPEGKVRALFTKAVFFYHIFVIEFNQINPSTEENAMLDCIINIFTDIADCFLDMGINRLVDRFSKKK